MPGKKGRFSFPTEPPRESPFFERLLRACDLKPLVAPPPTDEISIGDYKVEVKKITFEDFKKLRDATAEAMDRLLGEKFEVWADMVSDEPTEVEVGDAVRRKNLRSKS